MKIDVIYKKIGNKIRVVRKELGLTQDDLAERSGLDWSFIGQIERGVNIPSIRSLAKISKALHMKLKDLFTFETRKTDKGNLLADEMLSVLRNQPIKNRKFFLKLIRDITSHYKK